MRTGSERTVWVCVVKVHEMEASCLLCFFTCPHPSVRERDSYIMQLQWKMKGRCKMVSAHQTIGRVWGETT